MCKMFCSEVSWNIIHETIQIRSGRGFETAESLRNRGEKGIPVERFMRDCRINLIFEGTSEIMRLFIAREALDPHLKLAGDLLNPRAPLGKRTASFFKAGLHYAGWYPALWNPLGRSFQVSRKLAPHLPYADKASRRLARELFPAMHVYQATLERKQALLGRFGDIGTELFAMTATCARAEALEQLNPNKYAYSIDLAALFCSYAKKRVENAFRGIWNNHDRSCYRLAQNVNNGEYAWLEDGGSDIEFR